MVNRSRISDNHDYVHRDSRPVSQVLGGEIAKRAYMDNTCQMSRTTKNTSDPDHFPAKCSVMIAMNLSILPKMARCMMTGLVGGLSGFAISSGERYFRLKRSGSWKSSWMVAHWKERRNASRIVMSILGP